RLIVPAEVARSGRSPADHPIHHARTVILADRAVSGAGVIRALRLRLAFASIEDGGQATLLGHVADIGAARRWDKGVRHPGCYLLTSGLDVRFRRNREGICRSLDGPYATWERCHVLCCAGSAIARGARLTPARQLIQVPAWRTHPRQM